MKTVRRTLSQLPPDIVDRLNAASFFSSVGFAQLWATVGGRPVYWVSSGDSGAQAVVPGVEFGRGRLRRFQAMPDGCYATLVRLTDKPVEERQVALSVADALQAENYLKLYLTDYRLRFAEMATYDVVDRKTIVVDISEAGWQPPDKKIRSEIRKAEREGIRVQEFDVRRHRAGFLSLVRRTEERHGREGRYPERFFAALAELTRSDGRIRWVYTEYEGRPAASHINFVLGDTLLNWQVYFDRGCSFLKPNQYMLYSVAREAAEAGVRFLDLGASPDDADTLLTYKRKWGGREYTYPQYQLKSKLAGLL